jgi:hypothetical protein
MMLIFDLFVPIYVNAKNAIIGGTKRAPIGHMDPYRKLL